VEDVFDSLALPHEVAREPSFPDWVRRLILLRFVQTEMKLHAWGARLCFVAAPGEAHSSLPAAADEWDRAYRDALGSYRDAESLQEVSRVFTVPTPYYEASS
jgi:hypothetical protein